MQCGVKEVVSLWGRGEEGEGGGVRSGSLVSWHRYQRLLRHPRHLYVLFDQDKKMNNHSDGHSSRDT